MNDQRRDEIKISSWVIPILVSAIVSYGGFMASTSTSKEKIFSLERKAEAADAKSTALWGALSESKEKVIRHDALIPLIQKDIEEIKQGQSTMAKDIKEIARAVKA